VNSAIFIRAAEAYVALLGQIRPEQWDRPGLGAWTVRSLAGHTARAIITVENYVSIEAPSTATLPTAEAYYAAIASTSSNPADAAAVEARGVAAGEWLGSDPVARVADVLARVRELLASETEDRIVTVIGGLSIPLTEYLRTRVFELVVHSIDLSRATGLPSGLTRDALDSAAALASAIAVSRGDGEELLLALTGRTRLPEGFSVV
jgi:uncharacterized protein (TIGR03083 family)